MRDLALPKSRDTSEVKVKTTLDIVTVQTVFTRKTEETTTEVDSTLTTITETSTITATTVGTGTYYVIATTVASTSTWVLGKNG
jgi:hypothetical protein